MLPNLPTVRPDNKNNNALQQATMPKHSHANATTTPEMREFIRESNLPTAVLARLLKISEATVRKWRKRDFVEDASHKPHNLNTTLSPAQEYVVVELRKRLLLSLDELLAVTQEFIHPGVSRAGLQRCLKRHGVSRLNNLDESEIGSSDEAIKVRIEDVNAHLAIDATVSPDAMKQVLGVNDDEIVNVEVRELPSFDGESAHRRVLIANDKESGWVYVDIYDGNELKAAERYMSHVLTKAPFHIRRILAGNYNEFLNRFRVLENADTETE